MRRIILLIAVFFSLQLNGQVTLLKDINPSGNSFGAGFTEFNGQIFFLASNGTNGREIWVTDGTESGTTLFKDINPGSGSSIYSSFAQFNNELYFFADDGNIPTGLWKTDGTPEGTQFVTAVGDPAFGFRPYGLTVFEDALYFVAYDENGNELWVSDGTGEGTTMLADIRAGSESSDPNNFTVFDKKLFFVARPDVGRRVLFYVENGIVSAIDYSGSGDNRYANNPEFLTVFNDGLFFSADFREGSNFKYSQLGKVSTGVPSVSVITNINPGDDGYVESLAAGDNYLIFTAEEDNTGQEYWVSDGTPEGTELLLDIYPGSEGSLNGPAEVIAAGNLFFFNAEDPDLGFELWMSDGTALGTRVLDLNPGDASSFPEDFAVYRNTLLFTAQNAESGRELWTSLGNIDETLLVQDIRPGGQSSEASGFTGIGDRVYFNAQENFTIGSEPYYIDLADPCSLVECPEGETCFGGACYALCTPLDLGEDIYSITGEEVILDAGAGFTSYLWSNGETTQAISVTASGRYILEAGSNCYTFENGGLLYDTINVFFQCIEDTCEAGQICVDGFCYPDPCAGVVCQEGEICIEGGCFIDCREALPVDLGNDTVILAGETVLLDAGVEAVSYLWSTGETTRTITVDATNTYWVQALGNCYGLANLNNTDSLLVEVLCNDGNCPEGMSCIDGFCYDDPCALINCPYGHQCFQGTCFPDCNNVVLGPDTILQQGQQLVLDAGSAIPPYLWSTGDTSYSITVTEPGVYWLYQSVVCYGPADSIRVSYTCDAGSCPEGQTCVNGLCVIDDPCLGIECREGETCYQGSCYPTCPELDLGPDITVPAGTGITLDVGNEWSYVGWSTGELDYEILVNSSGRYIVYALGNGVCYEEEVLSDTINVIFTAYTDGSCPPGQFNLNGNCYASDQSLGCEDGYYRYNGKCIPLNDCSFLECPPGDTCYNGYCLPAFDPACEDCDSGEICYFGHCYPECLKSVFDIFISPSGDPIIGGGGIPAEFIRYITAAPGDTVVLDPGVDFTNVIWSNGATGPIEVTSTGNYTYIAENTVENCTYIGIVEVKIPCPPIPSLQLPPGYECVDDYVFKIDLCESVNCPPGSACYDGFCLQLDIQDCFSNPCPPGLECQNGFCVTDAACENVDCPTGESCYNGNCTGNFEVDLCEGVDCGGTYSCMYGTCMDTQPSQASGGLNGIRGLVALMNGEKKSGVYSTEQVANEGIDGARVYLLNPEMNVVYLVDTTDTEGRFEFQEVQDGNYAIVVEVGLFKMDENNMIEITAEKDTYDLVALVGDSTIALQFDAVSSTDSRFFGNEIVLYPNPSTGDIFLSAGAEIGHVSARLTDLSGRTVVSREVYVSSEDIRVVESGDQVLPGYYLLQIEKEGEILGTERVVIR